MIDWLWTRWERGTVVERERERSAVAVAILALLLLKKSHDQRACVEGGGLRTDRRAILILGACALSCSKKREEELAL